MSDPLMKKLLYIVMTWNMHREALIPFPNIYQFRRKHVFIYSKAYKYFSLLIPVAQDQAIRDDESR